jgi:hypothetical protein
MEWTVPLHSVNPNNIRVSPLQKGHKITAPITYSNAIAEMPSLSLILPAMTIRSYDGATGQLALLIPPAALKKLQAIQEKIVHEVKSRQEAWFPEYKREDHGFQPMIDGLLRLYCPIGVGGAYDIQICNGGEWVRGASVAALEPGSRIRVVLRIQGVSFHQAPTGAWTGKFRLQHRILGIFKTYR